MQKHGEQNGQWHTQFVDRADARSLPIVVPFADLLIGATALSRYREGQISARHQFNSSDQGVASYTRSSGTRPPQFNDFFGNIRIPSFVRTHADRCPFRRETPGRRPRGRSPFFADGIVAVTDEVHITLNTTGALLEADPICSFDYRCASLER